MIKLGDDYYRPSFITYIDGDDLQVNFIFDDAEFPTTSKQKDAVKSLMRSFIKIQEIYINPLTLFKIRKMDNNNLYAIYFRDNTEIDARLNQQELRALTKGTGPMSRFLVVKEEGYEKLKA